MAYVGALAVGVGEVPRIITYAHWSIKNFSGSAEPSLGRGVGHRASQGEPRDRARRAALRAGFW